MCNYHQFDTAIFSEMKIFYSGDLVCNYLGLQEAILVIQDNSP